MRVAQSAAGARALVDAAPSIVVVDLDNGRDAALTAVTGARAAGLEAPVVGFFSHVARALGDAAEAAGVTPVRRRRFWAALPEMLSGSHDT